MTEGELVTIGVIIVIGILGVLSESKYKWVQKASIAGVWVIGCLPGAIIIFVILCMIYAVIFD